AGAGPLVLKETFASLGFFVGLAVCRAGWGLAGAGPLVLKETFASLGFFGAFGPQRSSYG
ncbi:MAG: hypothetical protein ACLFUA_05355, partial [Spirochaetales bacterium]